MKRLGIVEFGGESLSNFGGVIVESGLSCFRMFSTHGA